MFRTYCVHPQGDSCICSMECLHALIYKIVRFVGFCCITTISVTFENTLDESQANPITSAVIRWRNNPQCDLRSFGILRNVNWLPSYGLTYVFPAFLRLHDP